MDDTTQWAEASVLVVDDDPVVRRLVRRAVERIGCGRVYEAADGIEAQAALETSDVDLVITDLMMPHLDGLDLMQWAQEQRYDAVWIILSGLDTFESATQALRLGAYEFLAKPPHLEQLEAVIRNALAQRHLLRERERLRREIEASHRALLEKVRELEEKSEQMRRDLRRAEVIQRVLLPSQPPALDGLCLQSVYRPGRHVGGDLYNVVRLGEAHVGIYIADATGHGVSSAMLSVLFHRKLVLTDESGGPLAPARVLAAVNRALCAERIAPGLFLTAAYCLLDTSTHRATLALAGHPPALLRRAEGSVHTVRRTGPALGLTDGAAYGEVTFEVRPGDRLLLYTDGLIEPRGAEAARSWLESALARSDADPRHIVIQLAESARAGIEAGDVDPDDITLLLIEARPGRSEFDNGETAESHDVDGARGVAPTPLLFYGESEDRSFLVVRGRGTWQHADVFEETAGGLIDEGRRVTIDLADCEYLDSTFLGTLHQLVSRESVARGRITLQRVRPVVRALFDELDMTEVARHIGDDADALPDVQPLVPASEPYGKQLRILRAHEALAALSARNREKFESVVEALRAQLRDPERPPAQ